MPIKKRTIPGIKHVRSAKTASTIPVDDFDSIASDWSQVDLIDPTDTNLVMQSGIAEHKSDKVFEYLNTKHQVTFILDGNVVVQDTETGEVFKGTAGDLFYWGPGLRIRMGGTFRALYSRTPIVWRWTKTPSGQKKVLNLFNIPNETHYEGASPDAVLDNPMESISEVE